MKRPLWSTTPDGTCEYFEWNDDIRAMIARAREARDTDGENSMPE